MDNYGARYTTPGGGCGAAWSIGGKHRGRDRLLMRGFRQLLNKVLLMWSTGLRDIFCTIFRDKGLRYYRIVLWNR